MCIRDSRLRPDTPVFFHIVFTIAEKWKFSKKVLLILIESWKNEPESGKTKPILYAMIGARKGARYPPKQRYSPQRKEKKTCSVNRLSLFPPTEKLTRKRHGLDVYKRQHQDYILTHNVRQKDGHILPMRQVKGSPETYDLLHLSLIHI